MNHKVKDNTNEVEDAFIRYNHEKKALKLAYKELKTAINKKIVEAQRNFFWQKNHNEAILLGRKYCYLISMVMETSLDDVDVENFNPFDVYKSELKLWGRPIWVSMEDDYKIEIIANLGSLEFDWGDLNTTEDPDKGLGKKPLVDMEKLIDDLPDSMKIKKI